MTDQLRQSTGIPALDELLGGGLLPGTLTVVVGATGMGKTARISVRVNPDVDAGTHAKISTGKSENKFGIPIAEAVEAYAEAKALPNIEVVGVDCHIGSQLVSIEPFADALALVRDLVTELRRAGHGIEIIDVGGGLGGQ